MFFKNAKIYCRDFTFRQGAFQVTEDGYFGAVLPENVPEDAIDLQGAKVIPGLVDVHIHGAAGSDFADGDDGGNMAMARYLASQGVTAFAPASVTLPYEKLEKAFAAGRRLADAAPQGCARLVGIHMEGPYFSYKKKGAQNGSYLKEPDFAGFEALQKGCGNLVSIVDIAPELPGAMEFIQEAKALARVSVAHTDASYESAVQAFAAGATHLTHLFNAMPGIHHRNPGVIPAAAENKAVKAELICDGIHVHPATVRLAFSLFGAERIVLVSDALRCCGMPEGEYELGGQIATLRDGVARLSDGTIAGSATDLFTCMERAIAFGIKEEDAIRAATFNPACAVGAEEQVGAIAPGYRADFVVLPVGGEKQVYLGGKLI